MKVDANMEGKARTSKLTKILLATIAVLTVVGIVVTILYPSFVFELQPGVTSTEQPYVPGGLVYETVYILLTMATNILYLVGGG